MCHGGAGDAPLTTLLQIGLPIPALLAQVPALLQPRVWAYSAGTRESVATRRGRCTGRAYADMVHRHTDGTREGFGGRDQAYDMSRSVAGCAGVVPEEFYIRHLTDLDHPRVVELLEGASSQWT